MGFNSEFKGLMYIIVNVLHNGDGNDDDDDDDDNNYNNNNFNYNYNKHTYVYTICNLTNVHQIFYNCDI